MWIDFEWTYIYEKLFGLKKKNTMKNILQF